jgi:hypothetical protein
LGLEVSTAQKGSVFARDGYLHQSQVKLGPIGKRGNGYLRRLLGWAVMMRQQAYRRPRQDQPCRDLAGA